MSLLRRLQRSPREVLVGATLKLSRYVHQASSHFKRRHKINLLVYDDFFPDVLSAFRIAEYNHYLECIAGTEIYSTRPCNFFFPSSGSFQEKLLEYGRYYPKYTKSIRKFNKNSFPHCRLAYTVFLNNAYDIVEHLEKRGVPFVFTLYPGGGFYLEEPGSDMKLKRVLSSPCFRKVLVTQKVTEQYLIQKGFCDRDNIEFIFGGVLPTGQLSAAPVKKLRYKEDKRTFDICFVAAKYTERGLDKGYDIFIEAAHRLCDVYPDVRFHVVGSFDSTDIDVSRIADKITFHGLKPTTFFPSFHSGMDIILSPNRAFTLFQGAFDGFPTGSCVEAGLCGVALFCSDPLSSNIAFADKDEIVIVPTETKEIVEIIGHYYQNPASLYELAAKGKEAFSKVFSLEAQMAVRMRILQELLHLPPECGS